MLGKRGGVVEIRVGGVGEVKGGELGEVSSSERKLLEMKVNRRAK